MQLLPKCGNCGKRAAVREDRVQRSPRVVAIEVRCSACGVLLEQPPRLEITRASEGA